ncbi:MAG: DUF2269 domain-containing protein [Sideroxydans sp.]|nr:DUF2269 domain-containing protein [Sideroxydans sp.]
MSAYLILKWLHILSSVLLVGVGFGSAFYMFFVNRTRNVAVIAEVSRLVVRADWWFTTPAVIIQPASGLAMVWIADYSLRNTWLSAALVLFVVAGISWLPVVWLQIQMAKMAREAAERNTGLPQRYWRFARIWTALGMIAFPAMLMVYGLMVLKP